jgi:hypothetical protein
MAKREKSWRRVVVVPIYADDLGYVPISSVRGKPCIIPQAVEVSELFGRQ